MDNPHRLRTQEDHPNHLKVQLRRKYRSHQNQMRKLNLIRQRQEKSLHGLHHRIHPRDN